MGTQQTQSMKRARHPESMVMRGLEGVPVASEVSGTAERAEVVAVGGGCCDDGGMLCVAALGCFVV